jgi:hypothetical protein
MGVPPGKMPYFNKQFVKVWHPTSGFSIRFKGKKRG